jgi:hypothetical protein
MTSLAGWYLDPNDHSLELYWDGQRWTEHRRRESQPPAQHPGGAPGPLYPQPVWSGPAALPAGRNYAALWLVPMVAFIMMAAFMFWYIPHHAAEHGSNEWYKKGYAFGQNTTLFHGGDVRAFCSAATIDQVKADDPDYTSHKEDVDWGCRTGLRNRIDDENRYKSP